MATSAVHGHSPAPHATEESPPGSAVPQTRLRALKFRLDPNRAQQAQLAQCAGGARWAYNALTAENLRRSRRYQARRDELVAAGASEESALAELKREARTRPELRILGYQAYATQYLTADIARHRDAAQAITDGADPAMAWSGERYEQPWLHTVPRRVLVSGLQHADTAFKNWMSSAAGTRKGRRIGYPRFKKKGRSRDSFTIPSPEVMGPKGTPHLRGSGRTGVIDDYRHLRLAFLGTIRTHESTKRLVRAIDRGAQMRSFTVSRSADRWYVSILVAEPWTPPAPTRRQVAGGTVGVDMGVKVLAALSTGELIDNPRHGRRTAKRLARLQRRHARTVKGSARRRALTARIGRVQHILALQRATTLHALSKRLVTEHATIAIEDLNVSGMVRSARGTIDKPGKNVRAKAGLSRSILDTSPAELRRQLDYKTRWHGASLVTIDRYAPSSKTCSTCGTVKSKLSLAERWYDCTVCGTVMDRDVNAARCIAAFATGEAQPLQDHSPTAGRRA